MEKQVPFGCHRKAAEAGAAHPSPAPVQGHRSSQEAQHTEVLRQLLLMALWFWDMPSLL